ncbi:hypothetical protein DL762_007997 [Monosporascus cannonballus]|uniref:DNA-directed RNA polymerase III subunit Rpc5 n=1 Tax=Monosporascus cannonballus TaxID=155416 RepID=A0ABY0GXG8_9PEZI|nr:hypothetical protein DL762_007997 [Monosporascus cannonballus]RYO98628.1 hypothetical protein DL763_002057 [Monosporascus cannonballus]
MEDDETTKPSAATEAVAAGAGADPDPDPDPIVASYGVYANPSLPASRQLLILQHPNRKLASSSLSPDLAVAEVRLKPRTGMVEVDVPLSHAHADYDREKGLRWGGALQRSAAAKGGGSHGLAGGFGVGVPPARGKNPGGKRGLNEEDLDMDMLADWSEAVRQDKVLRTQTLGGQYPLEAESNCRWMVGVFQGDQLHLTPATSLIHLRPQLHHLDAYAEQDRLSRLRETGAPAAASSSSSGAAGKDGAAAAPARAITMTIKSASTNEIAQETMADRLRAVQTEPWSRLKYEHEESDRAWDMFSSHLLYKAPPPASGSAKDVKDSGIDVKGKGKENDGPEDQLEKHAPRLRGGWSADEFLRAVSGRLEDGDGNRGADEGVQAKKEDGGAAAGTSRAPGKAPAAPATAAKRTGGKGKSVAFKSAAMEID